MSAVKRQALIWSLLAAVLVLALWGLGNVVLPFILGTVIAYLLDPLATRLERMGLSRTLATVVISAAALLLFVSVLLLVGPLLANQTIALVQAAPGLMESFTGYLNTSFPDAFREGSAINQALHGMAAAVQERGGELVQIVLGSLGSMVNIVLIVVVAPVVAFYLLLDWNYMIARINSLLPRDYAPTIRKLAREIDATVAAFLRGMFTVCLSMGVFYALGLGLVGLNYGIAVGAFAGLITFIPYVGAFLGGALAIGLALVQFWGDWWPVALVVLVFATGQMLEGNVITPKLVGGSVGLHPVWLIFALSVFGALFGFVGMLVAVPLAAAMGVLIRHAIARYQESELFHGPSIEEPEGVVVTVALQEFQEVTPGTSVPAAAVAPAAPSS